MSYPVKYTFGYDPLQQYLIPMSGGRIQAFTIAWDARRRQWFSLYEGECTEPGDWLHWTGDAMNWNYMCADGGRAHAHLPAGPEAPRAARALVAQVCGGLHLPRLCQDAQLIVSELVTNGVRHARSDLEVTVAVTATHLHLYVRDRDRTLPQLPLDEGGIRRRRLGGLGLRLVDSLATSWGTTIGAQGKTVWATLRLAGSG